MNYRATSGNPFQVCAGCVVIDTGKVLLLKRNKEPGGATGGYHLPKGTLELGETLEQCAIRETLEETGYKASLQEYLGSTNNKFNHPSSGQAIDKTTHYYLASTESSFPDAHDSEHDEVLWLEIKDAIVKLSDMPKSEEVILRRVIEHNAK